MLEGLSVLVGSEEVDLLAFGSLHNELVEGEALTTSGGDASTGSLGESKSGDSHLRDSEDSLIIGDGGNDNGGLTLIRLLLVMLDELRERKRRSVHSGGDKSSEDRLVEVRAGSSGEESEELDEQVNVEVGAPRVFLVRILNSTSFDEINSLQKQYPSIQFLMLRNRKVHFDKIIRKTHRRVSLFASNAAKKLPTISL